MEEVDEIDNFSIHSNDEYDLIDEGNSNYDETDSDDEENLNYDETDSDDAENQSENEEVQAIDSGLQFEKEIKFLQKRYSTTQIVKHHGYKFEEDRVLIHYQPLLPIFTFSGKEYLYKRDAFSTYELFYSLDEIRQNKSALKINPNIISIDDSYLFACRKKNLAIWNRYFITIRQENYLSIVTPEDLDVLFDYKNIVNNTVFSQLSQSKYFANYKLNINWIFKILIGFLNFNAVFEPSALTEYLKLSSIKIKKEYDKRKKNGLIKIIKDEKKFTRKNHNNRKKLCRKNRYEVKQNNIKSGSNSKIHKTQQAVQFLEEKAIVQSSPFNQNSEGKEISPSINIKTSFT